MRRSPGKRAERFERAELSGALPVGNLDFRLQVLLQGGYINTVSLSGAPIFLEVDNFKHLHIKRNSDILWNRM